MTTSNDSLLRGLRLRLALGAERTAPAPAHVLEAMQSLKVTYDEGERAVFQLTFSTARSRAAGGAHPLLDAPWLKPGGRVTARVLFGATARTLLDGFVVHQHLVPDGGAGTATLTVTGEDVGWKLRQTPHLRPLTQRGIGAIVREVIEGGAYGALGLEARVEPPAPDAVLREFDGTVFQDCSDWEFLELLARPFEHVVYVRPGDASRNEVYWGPAPARGPSRGRILVDAGPATNVQGFDLSRDGMASADFVGAVQDRLGNGAASLRSASEGGALRTEFVRFAGASEGRAQAELDARARKSRDGAVVATGRLDAARFGDVLRAYDFVTLQGAGGGNDGLYRVRRVEHELQRGEYRQNFRLSRADDARGGGAR